MCRVVLHAGAALLTLGVTAAAARADDAGTCRTRSGDEAITACSRLIERNPNDAVAWHNRGRAYGKGDDGRAIADLGQAIRIDPRYAGAYNLRGNAYLRQREYDRAIADYDQAIRIDPRDATAYGNQGVAYDGKGDYDRAIVDLDQAIGIDPKRADAYVVRGDIYRHKHEYDHAIADYDQAIRIDAKDADIFLRRGYANDGKGDYDRAIADYGQAIRINPIFAEAYRSRGVAYASKGEPDRAIADYGQAIRLDPRSADAYENRGNAYYGKHDYDLAIADYDQAIRLDPKNNQAYADRGYAYRSKGDYDRAIADYSQAIRLDPKSADAYNSRGFAYNHKGDYDHAIADLNEAIRLKPDYANPYSHRGFAYGKKGDFDLAMRDLNKAVTLDRKYARGYANRAAVHELIGDVDRAIADADRAIQLDPESAFSYNIRGKAYAAKGQYALAISDYDQAVRLEPALAEARQNRERVGTAMPLPQISTGAREAIVGPPLQEKPAAASPPVPAEHRVALVIGNSKYRAVPFLPNPHRDAEAVATALREAGFQTVTLLSDLDRDAMRKALRSFRATADAADWGVVYYAGHGLQIGKTNYLVPIDAELRDERDVDAETVSYAELEKSIGGARALRLIILDACRVDPFASQMARVNPGRTVARGLSAPPEPEPGLLVVYSARDGQVAEDGDGANSPFTEALVARLKMPGREVRRVFDDVRDDVLSTTNRRQQPFTYGSLPGRRDFFFVAGR